MRFVEVEKPSYVYMKLTPNRSIRNYQTARLLQFVAEMYASIMDRVNFDLQHLKLKYECRSKIAYYIYMTKEKIEFYFIVDKSKADLLEQRISDVWKNMVTVTYVKDIPKFETYNYYLDYKFENALSTRHDAKDNDLLSSILNSSELMHDGDQAGILFNFTPIYQQGWLHKYNETMKKVKTDAPFYKNKVTPANIFFTIFDLLDKLLTSLFNVKQEKSSYAFDVSEYTRAKKKKTVVSTQIVCASNNKDASISLCEAFRIIDNDNQIIKYRSEKKMNYEAYKLQCGSMLTSVDEAQNFISLPGNELLKEHKIEHTDILEKNVPEELQHGYICLGTNICRGKATKGYLMDHVEIGAMPLILDGEQGAGKTTFIGNYVRDCLTRDEGCVIIDYIKNCELCDAIKKVVPKDKVIEIDMSDVDNVQGIGYNELKPKSNKTKDIVECANMKAQYISRLINALGTKENELSDRMDKFLNAASNILMCCENASLRDVMKCLNEHEYRAKVINAIPKAIARELAEEIGILKELDEKNDKGIITGTKYSKIEGINDRISRLKKDYRLKKMFYKDCSQNVDLIDAMEKGKIVLVRMPQIYFSTPYSRNVVVTYLFTKIWAASIVRGMMHPVPKRCHIITDEIFQAPETMKLLQDEQIVPQTRKFQTKMVFSCQYTKQIETILETLDAAGASYMLMKGSTKANFDEFKNDIAPFTLEDLQSLKQYHSLNIVNTEEGKKVFITKLPPPIK